jgi:photosynthetic reaction center cytochrome c subunit
MNNRTRKIILAAAGLMLTLALTFAGAHAQGGAAQTAAPVKTVGQDPRYKNVQVLKDLPADQLIPAMQFIETSLGVECETCHVEGAYEKDDKPLKKTARDMMKMQMEINKNNFGGNRQVTCNTCHRGAEQPASIPVVKDTDAPNPPRAPETPAAAGVAPPTADQVLDKFLQAVGGADALAKITTRVEKGNVIVGTNKTPIDVFAKAPNKRVSVSHQQNGDSFTAFDGTAGWMGNTGRPARDMTAAESANSMIDSDFALAADLKAKQTFKQFRMGRPDKIGDRDVYVLSARAPGMPSVRFYFDQQTGLLVRLVKLTDVGLGTMPVQIDYADYRDADGIKIPFRWTLARPNGRFSIQIDSVQQNVPVDDAKFAKPTTPGQ